MTDIIFPSNPRATIEVVRETIDKKTKKKTSESIITYDSWDAPRLFKSVEVELTTNAQSQAVWKIFDPKLRVINFFTTNNAVETFVFRVYLGFGYDLGEPVFKGILANVERDQSDTTFTIFDMGFKMKQFKKAGYHNKKNDLDILKLLAERNELLFSPPDKPKKLEPYRAVTQDEQTDWEHALERARESGLVLFVRQDTLFARYPAQLAKPKLILQNRKADLFSDFEFVFRTPENQNVRPRIVKFRGRGKGGKRLEGKSSVNDKGTEPISIKRDIAGRVSKSKLSARAQAQKDLEREHAFEGRVTLPFIYPDVRLDVRDTVGIENIGNLFSQPYLCDTVKYTFGAGRMELSLDLYRDFVGG